MGWQAVYEKWNTFGGLDPLLKAELDGIAGDNVQLEDRFCKVLEFGTAGMRGEIGAGTNRMNVYTVRKAAEGLARYIEANGELAKHRGVVIAYDSRHQSPEFALEVARTVGKHGVKAYLFDGLRPTPELSFAVRYLYAFAGVVITASHNPPEYNGFKVYGPDGGQLTPDVADELVRYVDGVEDELLIEAADEEELVSSEVLTYISERVDKAYLAALKTTQLDSELVNRVADSLKIVYTPLHGTGNLPVRQGLEAFGFKNVEVVKEQELPDADFSTVTSPNPEERDALALAIEYGHRFDADLLIGTDPDADRLGAAVKNAEGEFIVLSGNQIGALLLHYILLKKKEKGTLPENGVMLKTIVTSELGREIARSFGVSVIDTLTGFKFIGEKIAEFEQSGEHAFLFGYEESNGYLAGDFVRDKDAVQAAVLLAEAAAYYKDKGQTLYDGLMEIYDQYGYYTESLQSLTLKGQAGVEEIARILNNWRENPPASIASIEIAVMEDYLSGERKNMRTGETETIDLPKSNVLKFHLEDGSWFCVRPSGTEPKAKFYFATKADSPEKSRELIEQLEKDVMAY